MVPAKPRVSEHDLRAPVLAHLARDGYRAWAAPDGRDYFDIVACRGAEVGLVELKVANAAKVFAQAVRRRAWADWVAVALPGERAARRLLTMVQAPLAERVGVWQVTGASVRVLRPARPLWPVGGEDPFAEARARFRALVDQLRSGELPDGVDWGIFGAPRLPGRGRRSTRDWRLEEFPAEPDGSG
jgi:hypothetical protein